MNNLVKAIKDLTISDLSKEIDLGKLLAHEYNGNERDLAIYLTKEYYKDYKVADAHIGIQEQALSYSKYFAIKRLLIELPDLIERTTTFMLTAAQENGWYRRLEYDNIEELLASVYDEKKARGTNEWHEWKFLVERLVPMAKQMNIDVDTVIGASVQHKKLRNVVPAARLCIDQYENDKIDASKAAEDLRMLITTVADPSITVSQANQVFDEYRGKTYKADPPIEGETFLLPNKTLMVISVTDKQLAMVEQALRGRVEFAPRDPAFLFNSVASIFNVDPIKNRGGDYDDDG